MIDPILLNHTLQKITASLNKRFEKEADLYISRQDEYELKKYLCNGKYQAVHDMMKGKSLSPEVILRVVIRNAGVLKYADPAVLEKQLMPVLEEAYYPAIAPLFYEVLQNNLYMSKDIRHLLFPYVVYGIPVADQLDLWKNTDLGIDITEREILFNCLMDCLDGVPKKMDFMQRALFTYPFLLQDENLLTDLELTPQEEEELYLFLCQQMELPNSDEPAYTQIILNKYIQYGDVAFQNAVERLKDDNSRQYKVYIRAVAQLLFTERDSEMVVDWFDQISSLVQDGLFHYRVLQRLNHKVWFSCQKNSVLYNRRSVEIDAYIRQLERRDESYTSFEEVIMDLHNGESAQTVAFRWINMRKNFGASLRQAFQQDGWAEDMQPVFYEMFKHAEAMGHKRIEMLAGQVADEIRRYCGSSTPTGVVAAADTALLEIVCKYKKLVQKYKNIAEYMESYHFDIYRDQFDK